MLEKDYLPEGKRGHAWGQNVTPTEKQKKAFFADSWTRLRAKP
jgi:hypothetical protein